MLFQLTQKQKKAKIINTNKKVTSMVYMCVQNTGVGCGTCNFRNVCTA